MTNNRTNNMANNMRHKLLAFFVIFTMVFTMSACGSNAGSGSGSPGSSDIAWELTDNGYEAEYDFGASVDGSGDTAMMTTLDKLDYSDLDALQEVLQTAAEEGTEAVGLEKFEFVTDYEAMEETIEEAQEEGYDIGDIVYCSGMEGDDMDMAAFESGVYNNPMDGKYYQYSILSSQTYYGSDETDIDALIETMQKAYGISLDKAKLEQAVKAIEEKSKEPVPEDESQDSDEDLVIGKDEDIDLEDDDDSYEDLSDEDGLVFYDEDGNEIDLSDIEFIEEDEDGDADEEYYDDEESDVESVDSDEYADGEDEEYETLTEDEMNDLVFADEDDFEGGYPCILTQTLENSGDGYSDKISVSLIAQQISEEDSIIYLSVEFDRCYDEQ